MKNEKNYRGFRIPKVWKILKRFAGAFRQAQTSYFWRVTYYIVLQLVEVDLPTTSLTLLSKWNDSFWWMKVKIALEELLCTPSRNSFAQNADEAFSSVCLHKLRYANLMAEFVEHIAVKFEKKCNFFGLWGDENSSKFVYLFLPLLI